MIEKLDDPICETVFARSAWVGGEALALNAS